MQGIFEELMLNFHESPEKIVGLLKIISDYDNSLEKNFIIHKGIVSLHLDLLGCLNYLKKGHYIYNIYRNLI